MTDAFMYFAAGTWFGFMCGLFVWQGDWIVSRTWGRSDDVE